MGSLKFLLKYVAAAVADFTSYYFQYVGLFYIQRRLVSGDTSTCLLVDGTETIENTIQLMVHISPLILGKKTETPSINNVSSRSYEIT